MGKKKKITHNGETLSVTQWAERLGISHQALRERLKNMPPCRALKSPNCGSGGRLSPKTITHNGETLKISEWAKRAGVTYACMYDRFKKMTPERAINLKKEK